MNKAKILVIDDSSETLAAIEEYLEDKGYQVIGAINGVDGLRLATEEHPDLILLDVMMPLMDGREVLEKIKDRRIPTRVIIMSAYMTSTSDIVYFIKSGACDYIIKPFKFDNLINLIERALVVEATINLNLSDNSLIQQLIANTEKLQRDQEKLIKDNEKLIKDNEKLKKQVLAKGYVEELIWMGIKLLGLFISTGITIILYSLNIISKSIAIILPFILFFFIFFPFQRTKKLSVKVPKVETDIEMDDESEKA
jgi:DNA-binding response OmpR family regulator